MDKKEIKINFRYFDPNFNSEDNLFTDLLRRRYHVVISDNPDYVFYSVYPENAGKGLGGMGRVIKKISPDLYIFSRKIVSKVLSVFKKKNKVEGKFVKIFFGAEHTKPNMKECDWAFSSHFEEEINHPKYMRIASYRVTDFKLENAGKPPIKKDLDLEQIKKEKTKFCNFIYSQDIKERNEFFKILNEYKPVDSPGRCMNNMPAISVNDPKKSREAVNWAEEKLKFIRPYKFTIAFENFSSPGWVTEKLTHPMLVNSVPIYFGHGAVKEDFNTKSFINFHDFKDMKEFVEHIIKVDNDDSLYEEYLRQPFYENNIPSEYVDDERILKRFEEIFG